MSLDIKNTVPATNTIALAEGLGSASSGASLAGDIIGNSLMLVAPALAGPFVQLNYAIKLIDKLRYINVRFGSVLTAFMSKIGGGGSSETAEDVNEFNVSEGKLTFYKARYSLGSVTMGKMILFLVLYILRQPKIKMIEEL